MTKLLCALGMVFLAAVIGGAAFVEGDLLVLPYVAAFGHPDVLFALTAAGAGLHRAVMDDNIAEVKRLIADGADINEKDNDGWTPLHLAEFEDRIEIVSTLVNAGANVNAKDNNDFTPFHFAAANGRIEILPVLIGAGRMLTQKLTRA